MVVKGPAKRDKCQEILFFSFFSFGKQVSVVKGSVRFWSGRRAHTRRPAEVYHRHSPPPPLLSPRPLCEGALNTEEPVAAWPAHKGCSLLRLLHSSLYIPRALLFLLLLLLLLLLLSLSISQRLSCLTFFSAPRSPFLHPPHPRCLPSLLSVFVSQKPPLCSAPPPKKCIYY